MRLPHNMTREDICMSKIMRIALLLLVLAHCFACGDENCGTIENPDGSIEYYDCPGDGEYQP